MKKNYTNLREFIDLLEKEGELVHITQEVSPYLEISHITNLASKSPNGGKALLFENVTGSRFPVITNAFGSPKRICLALGVSHLDELGERISKILNVDPPGSFRDMTSMLPVALDVVKSFPRPPKKSKAPCQEVVYTGDEVDLLQIPVLHCWPRDGGPFVTLPLVFTRSLLTGRRNVGMYRLQIFDRNTTGMHWHIHKDGSHFYNEYVKAGRRMEVAVAIGTDPATTYAATAPLPRGMDEMILAGFIRQKPVPMVKCLTVDMEVPAEAEFVLEGYVDPGETRKEGPFGDHTGYYSLVDEYPVFHVTAVTHRKNAIYSATVVGRPPMEDCYLAKATERLFLPLLGAVIPEIKNYYFPWEGVFHNIVVVSIEKEYPGQAQKVMHGLWGQGQMSYCKAIVTVDADVDPKDGDAVLREFLERLDVNSDILITRGILDVLDHSAPDPLYGGKIGIDLTSRLRTESPRYSDSDSRALSPSIDTVLGELTQTTKVDSDCRIIAEGVNRILLISIEKGSLEDPRKLTGDLLGSNGLGYFNIFIVFDHDIDLSDNSLILWKLFNNVDPVRDIRIEGNRVVIDACKKGIVDQHTREWPEDIVMTSEVVDRIREKGISFR